MTDVHINKNKMYTLRYLVILNQFFFKFNLKKFTTERKIKINVWPIQISNTSLCEKKRTLTNTLIRSK